MSSLLRPSQQARCTSTLTSASRVIPAHCHLSPAFLPYIPRPPHLLLPREVLRRLASHVQTGIRPVCYVSACVYLNYSRTVPQAWIRLPLHGGGSCIDTSPSCHSSSQRVQKTPRGLSPQVSISEIFQ